ncbi:MAG: SMP-30/gluconolactonase/LRE family protein [Pseudomonadales bacterium]|jgi:sugar lactone lactonase YvrE
MTLQTERLLEGLCFGEGPRWHQGALWLSDMHAHEVLRVTADGQSTTVVTVPAQPSGLGWLPGPDGAGTAGDLLIVSMLDRKVLRYDGRELRTHADLGALARFHCNDMVVDALGRAWVGNFGFDLHGGARPVPTELIVVESDGSPRVAATDLLFPNGTVITPDGATLIIGESMARRLTAFDLQADGTLVNRRIWAELPGGALPDGICLDSAGGIWSASPSTGECLRQVEGGQVTHRVALDQGAYACMLGGDDGRTLYILTAGDSDPARCRATRSGRIEICTAPYPHAGLP